MFSINNSVIYYRLTNVLDVCIRYNIKTNEINGDGIYVLHPETKLLNISALNPYELQLEEERFIKLINPDIQVSLSSTIVFSFLIYNYLYFHNL